MKVCRRASSHRYRTLSWQRLPAHWPHPAGYAPYEVECVRCGDTYTNDDLGGEPIGEYEAIQAGLFDPTEI